MSWQDAKVQADAWFEGLFNPPPGARVVTVTDFESDADSIFFRGVPLAFWHMVISRIRDLARVRGAERTEVLVVSQVEYWRWLGPRADTFHMRAAYLARFEGRISP